MKRVPRVTKTMRASLDTVRDSRGTPRKGGVMVVPAIMDPQVWQARAMAYQERLMVESKT